MQIGWLRFLRGIVPPPACFIKEDTMSSWNQQSARNRQEPIRILGRSIVILHKVLKEEDKFRAMRNQEKYGEAANVEPAMAIDLTTVTCIQEDYKYGGTVIIDKKTAVIVKEQFADVLDVWVEAQNRMENMQSL